MGVENEIESYINAFNEFETYVKMINFDKSETKYSGYLINLVHFNRFKQILMDYQNGSKLFTESGKKNFLIIPESSYSNDLINKINVGYKFIIINNSLFNKICDQNIHNIKYQICSKYILLYTEDDKCLKFQNNKDNIISKNALLENQEIFDSKKNIDEIYKDVINYFNNGKLISDKLNNKNNEVEIYKGFLVDKILVDKWKKYSYYELIKSKYLINNNKDENGIKSLIRQEQEKNKLNYDEVNDIENYIIKDIKNLVTKENSNKLFIILEPEFIKSFHVEETIYSTTFFLSYQKIEIKQQDKQNLSFSTSRNILSIKSFNNINQIKDDYINMNQYYNIDNNGYNLQDNINQKNTSLNKTIIEIKKQLNEEKMNNQKLSDENNKMKKTIELLKQENINIKQKLEYKINKLKIQINNLENEINNKNMELQLYIKQNNKLNENIITATKLGEKIISVNFMTMGNQDISNYSMPCKKGDLFIKLEEKLYNDFPKYKNYETYFEVNGKRIKRFKTLEENNIQGNDIINLFFIEE